MSTPRPKLTLERHVIVRAIEENEERIVVDVLALGVAPVERVAGEEEAHRCALGPLPVRGPHLAAVRPEPGDVGELAPGDALATEEQCRDAVTARLENAPNQERQEALRQIHLIASLRLAALVEGLPALQE